MRNAAFALACLACVSYGRETTRSNSISGQSIAGFRSPIESKLLLLNSQIYQVNPMKALASTLFTLDPAAGWQGSGSGHSLGAGSRSAASKLAVTQSSSAGVAIPSTSFLNQERAIQVDVDLMSPEGGFSIDQLMELAGLSVSSAVAKEYPPDIYPRVLIICGPGNNGGDGLVAARHLHHFGYRPTVVYPKMEKVIASNELYRRLTVQLQQLGVPVTEEWQSTAATTTDLIIDAVFGFSFKGWRGGGKDAPFDNIIDFLSTEEGSKTSFAAPVVSVDIPSGWDVERGPLHGKAVRPDMLVSLTAPKQCALSFRGRFHYLGGRFVPPSIVEKNNLDLPAYPGAEQCVKLE